MKNIQRQTVATEQGILFAKTKVNAGQGFSVHTGDRVGIVGINGPTMVTALNSIERPRLRSIATSCRRAPACFATTTPSSRLWRRCKTRSAGCVPTRKTEGLDVGPADRLAVTVSQQEELTERFKSSNALLQNSLSYVGLLSTSPPFGAHDAQLAPATGALTAALLYLIRDTSPDAVKALEERIDQFAAQAPFLYGVVFAVIGVVPVYCLGRAIALLHVA